VIEYLRGQVLLKSAEHVVLDVNGVGYGVEATTAALHALPEEGQQGELHTYLYVQEGVLRLYGFVSRRERELFEVFMGVSGIGPRTALTILSTVEVPVFARAILQSDIRTLTKIPGIGKKSAERLTIELRDKVQEFAVDLPSLPGEAPGRGTGAVAGGDLREAMAAMEALGCKPLVAERAIGKAAEVLGPEATVPELVREGLKHRY
jgi:holliday junction DNA helicase RuvA